MVATKASVLLEEVSHVCGSLRGAQSDVPIAQASVRTRTHLYAKETPNQRYQSMLGR